MQTYDLKVYLIPQSGGKINIRKEGFNVHHVRCSMYLRCDEKRFQQLINFDLHTLRAWPVFLNLASRCAHAAHMYSFIPPEAAYQVSTPYCKSSCGEETSDWSQGIENACISMLTDECNWWELCYAPPVALSLGQHQQCCMWLPCMRRNYIRRPDSWPWYL